MAQLGDSACWLQRLQIFYGISTCKAQLDTLRRNKTDIKMVVSMSFGFDLTNISTDKDLQLMVADHKENFGRLYARWGSVGRAARAAGQPDLHAAARSAACVV
jgi:hypothetical protein